jgi:hypothetical protein
VNPWQSFPKGTGKVKIPILLAKNVRRDGGALPERGDGKVK